MTCLTFNGKYLNFNFLREKVLCTLFRLDKTRLLWMLWAKDSFKKYLMENNRLHHWLFNRNSIVMRSGKIVWGHGWYCWYFHLSLKYLGWPYRKYIKTAKNSCFCEELLNENDFEAFQATFCCYDHGLNASEAVQKFPTDQKDYRKCSSCIIVCWIDKIYQSIAQGTLIDS